MKRPARLFRDSQWDEWVRSRLPPSLQAAPSRFSRYKGIVRDVAADLHLEQRSDWNSYQQGYASFVDCWFYRDTSDFRRAAHTVAEKRYAGVCVALCRDVPCFVMGQAEKTWSQSSGSSYLPSLGMVDCFKTAAIAALAETIAAHLNRTGLVRLRPHDLNETLPPGFLIETNLSNDPLTLFDALFYWFD